MSMAHYYIMNIIIKNMNYTIIYTQKEKPNRYKLPVFETWQGNEKRFE